MLLGQLIASNVAVLFLVSAIRVLCLLPPPLTIEWYNNVSGHAGILVHISGLQCCDATSQDSSNWAASPLSEIQVCQNSWFNNQVI